MESIAELRQICQHTRPAIFQDFLSRWYYRLSIYFTWVCLRLGLSANQVTLLSGGVACLGGALLAVESPFAIVAGALCFHIFAILDMSDGEVARYRGQGGAAGHYLDWVMHFVSSTALMLGLLFSCMSQLGGPWLLVGVLAVLVPLLDKSISTSTWTVIAWTRLRDQQKGLPGAWAGMGQSVASPGTPSRPYWLRRLTSLALAPLQDHWLPAGLLLLAGAASGMAWVGLPFPDYRMYLLLYVGLVGIPYLALRVRRIVMSPILLEGYRRLFCPDRPIKLPEDDFLG